jgi:hypothetical protein
LCIFVSEQILNLNRAVNNRNDACEFREYRIPGCARNPAAVLGDRGVDDEPMIRQNYESCGLVALHVAAEALDIGRQDRYELALEMWGFHSNPSSEGR